MDTGAKTTETESRPIARVQGRVLDVLQSGERLTALDIAQRARVTDPRGHIAALKRKGVSILDEWIKSPTWGTRCKVFFIKP